MKTKLLFLTILCMGLISCTAGAGGMNENPFTPVPGVRPETFSNPVIRGDWPDPTVWEADGVYYTIATGVGEIYTSKNLYTWTKTGKAPLSSSALAAAKKAGAHFWAPDVVKIGNNWMLYLTCYNADVDSGIFAFCSELPSGPFEYVGKITHSKDTGIKDTIDAEVVVEDGKVWLFFGSVGRIHRVQLSDDGKSLAKDAEYVHVAGNLIDDDSSRETVFEGSYLLRRGEYWYLFVSSGNYWDASYRLKVGRSKSLEGEFLAKDGTKMKDGNATVVLSSSNDDRFYGPGHNGDVFVDGDGSYYMFYHCHDKTGGSGRPTMLQRMFWDEDGWPYFDGGKPLEKERTPVL